MDEFTCFVKITARILQQELVLVNIDDPTLDDAAKENLKKKSLTGKFPILETGKGQVIFESISIAKFLARQQTGLYGANGDETSQIDSWIDHVNNTVMPVGQQLMR
jgi:glutathione S-transferase